MLRILLTMVSMDLVIIGVVVFIATFISRFKK